MLTSAYEGLPGAIVEALSVGLDVVATRCCASMADLLDHGRLGTLVDVGDMVGFARAIATLRAGRQDAGRARAKAQAYTLEAAVPGYLALFAATAGTTPAPRDAPRHVPGPQRITAAAA